MRCFLAVELPRGVQSAIQEATAAVRAALRADLVRWLPIENVHLTLKFLGETPPSIIGPLEAALRSNLQRCVSFTLPVGGFGAYPSKKRARVLWVGLSNPDSLELLHHSVDAASVSVGFGRETRPFSPHLTIGRIRQHIAADGLKRIREVLENTRINTVGSLTVDAVHLFRSDLHAAGPEYTRMHTVRLAGGPPADAITSV